MVLVYQAYGRDDVIRQTQFSIVSLLSVLKPSSPIQIWVYTDNRALFADYFQSPRLRWVEVTPQQIQTWRGAINFVHRVKVEVLQDAASQFEGPLFYVDGDTYFREDPTNLFSGVSDEQSLMHIAEGRLSDGGDPLTRKIAKFVRKNTFDVGSQELVQMPESTVMWNAGAIGISQKNKSLLKKILALTDAMHSLYPKHVMEQLAFSYYLQTHSKIFSGEKEIGHYWDQKEEYQKAIDEFLLQNPNEAMAKKAYANFAWPAAKSSTAVMGDQGSKSFFRRAARLFLRS
jgi:hypothetical protein